MSSSAQHCPSPEENTNKNNNQTQPEETDKDGEKQNHDVQHHHHRDHCFVHGKSKSIIHMPLNEHEVGTEVQSEAEAGPADGINHTDSKVYDKLHVCKNKISEDSDDEEAVVIPGNGIVSRSKNDSVANACGKAMAKNDKMLHIGHAFLSDLSMEKYQQKDLQTEAVSKNGCVTNIVVVGYGREGTSKNDNVQNGYGETSCKTENMEKGYGETMSKSENQKKVGYGEAKCGKLENVYGCYSSGLSVDKYQHQVDEKDIASGSFLNMSHDTLRPGIVKSQSAPNSLLASLMGLEDDFLRQEAEFARLFPQDVAAFENHSTVNGHATTPVNAHILSMSLSQAASSSLATTSVLASTRSPASATTTSANLHGSSNGFAELPCPKRQCNRKSEVQPVTFHSKLSDALSSSHWSSSDNTDPNTKRNLLKLPPLLSSQSLSPSSFGATMMTVEESLPSIASLPLNSNGRNTCFKEIQMLLSDSQFATPSIQAGSVEKSSMINPGSMPAGSQQLSGHAFDAGMYSSTYNMAYNGERSNPTMSFLPQQTPVDTTATPQPKVASYTFLARQACPTRCLTTENGSMQKVFGENRDLIASSTRATYPGLLLQLNNGSPDASDRVNVLASYSSGNSSEEGMPIYASSSNILLFPAQKRNSEPRNNKSPSQHESSIPCEEPLTDSFTIGSSDDLNSMENNVSNNSVICRTRAKRGCATHPRSIAERVRRTKISERMKKLQDLVPHIDKQANTAVMLDEIVEYIKQLQNKVQVLTEEQSRCQCQQQISCKHAKE